VTPLQTAVHALVDACTDEAALRQAALALLGQAQGRAQPAPPPAQALTQPASSRAKAKPKAATRRRGPALAQVTPDLIARIGAAPGTITAKAESVGMTRSQLATMLKRPGAMVRMPTFARLQEIALASAPPAPEPALAQDPDDLADLVRARAQALGLRTALEVALACGADEPTVAAIMDGHAPGDHPGLRAWATDPLPASDQLRALRVVNA